MDPSSYGEEDTKVRNSKKEKTSSARKRRNELLNDKSHDKKDRKKNKNKDEEEIELKSTKRKEKDLGEELFKEIFETQQDSIAILERIINKADESQALAEESMEMLKIQGEQIVRIDNRLDELGSAITRGGRELKSLFRRLQTEKIILLIVALIALAILGLIIWGLVSHFCKTCKR
jgi:hypothetical protein